MAEKKISFGFKQTKKHPLLLPLAKSIQNDDNSIEMIQCLEENTIKLVNEKPKTQDLLIIPLKSSDKTSAALKTLRNLQTTLSGEENPITEENSCQNATTSGKATLEQRVVSELMAEARNEITIKEDSVDVVGLSLKNKQPPLNGAKESTMDDYESIPVTQFGAAMLRGMGIKDEEFRSKSTKELELRPKGMGLGADKLTAPKKLLVTPAADEVLEIKIHACIRILAGKNKDLYGRIEGFDDQAGRVIVKMAIGGVKETVNEFMLLPVSRKEYEQYGKVINSSKYDEYKKRQIEADKPKTEHRTIRKEPDSPAYRNMPSEDSKRHTNKTRNNFTEKSDRDDRYSRHRRTHKSEEHRSRRSIQEESPPRYSKERRNHPGRAHRDELGSASTSKAAKYENSSKPKSTKSDRSGRHNRPY